jgi:anti-sigma regulatory factor (Ser/Thr protein kinase)
VVGVHGGPEVRGRQVGAQAAEPAWPSAAPPPASEALGWELSDIAELPRVRAELRRFVTAEYPDAPPPLAELLDQLVLALDEMASNALRHGGGGVRAAVRTTPTSWLIEVCDRNHSRPPTPAVGRDPSEGGLGLYLIADLASEHGWYVRDGCKHVWALLPRV